MDIANPQLKQRKKRKRLLLAGGAAAAVLIIVLALVWIGPALPAVERSSLWIGTVKRGDMLREVRATGTLVPRHKRWLAAATAAQVDRILVLPGATVEPDTVLMKLNNPEVADALRNAKAQVAAAEANVAAKRAELDSQLLDERSALAKAKSDYASAKVKAEADAKADELHLIPHVQYRQELIALKQLKSRVKVERERVATFADSTHAQVNAAKAALVQQRSNLQLRQRQVDALTVKAGIAGVLQQVPVQEGEQVAEGTKLAQVARPDVLIARLKVPEVQAKDVAIGMPVSVDTHNGVVKGKVERINPAVVDGSVLGEVFHDINALAERLQAERLEFEETSHLLGKTLATLSSAVFVFDAQWRLRLVNPAGQALLDKTSQDLFGCSAAQLSLDEWLRGPTDQVVTHAFPGRGGRFEMHHAPLRSHGRGGRLLVVNDVGRVLRAEERQAWQRLLRVLGHEVNNSLAPIRSMADTLATLTAREPLPHDWREDVAGGLKVISNRAGALSRFLTGYSRLARLPLPDKRDVDVSVVAAKVVHLERRLPVRMEAAHPVRARVDPDQLEQALINLVGNAVEASLHGEVSIRLRAERDRIRIDVIDDGPGPPPSDNLFVPFFTTKPGGSGIGLALVRQIAEAHDGGVSLVARTDGTPGAVARLWLPKEAVGDAVS